MGSRSSVAYEMENGGTKNLTLSCKFWLENRGRFCKFQAIEGTEKCIEHSERVGARKRIPCPLDSSHSVYEDSLTRHLRSCSVTRDDNGSCSLPFFNRQGILHAGCAPSAPIEGFSFLDEASECQMKRLLLLAAALESAIHRESHEIGMSCSFHPEGDDSKWISVTTRKAKPSVVHGTQNDALLLEMQSAGFLEPLKGHSHLLLELGCGKAELVRQVAEDLPDPKATDSPLVMVVVDRDAVTNKAEARKGETASRVLGTLRLRYDIAHFDVMSLLRSSQYAVSDSCEPKPGTTAWQVDRAWTSWKRIRNAVPSWPPARVTYCAKHLCGFGLDLALSVVVSSMKSLPDGNCDPYDVNGTLATCCHHRCEWQSIYSSSLWEKHIGTISDFKRFRSLASWATTDGLEPAKRQLGRLVKRVFDLDRILFLVRSAKQVMDSSGGAIKRVVGAVKYSRYVPLEITPENWCISFSARFHRP